MATVNVTVGMTPEMLEKVDRAVEQCDMSRAQFVRHCIRQAEDSPFKCPEESVEIEPEGETQGQKGAA